VAWILDAQGAVDVLLSDSGYLAPFVVLVLCGFGLPVPEEITMLGAGFILYESGLELLPMVGVCIAGTLIGDSVPFWIGRHWGRRALRNKAVRRAVHPERLRAIDRRFRRQGALAVFGCRFVPGLRLPAWFTAGTLGMPYLRFIAIDALGAALMAPVFVLLGRASGEKIAELERTVENLHLILGFVVLAGVATLIGHLLITRRWPAAGRRGLGGGAPANAPRTDGEARPNGADPAAASPEKGSTAGVGERAEPVPAAWSGEERREADRREGHQPLEGDLVDGDLVDGDRP
jgi:membrane protein DedA with SNARE-associated domain